MRPLLAALVVSLSSGCAGNGDGPSLKAFSEPNGVLHVSGSGWEDCAHVTVDLPDPWTALNKTTVDENGRFSLEFAHPIVKPYEGAVAAACAESPERKAVTEIGVGDERRDDERR